MNSERFHFMDFFHSELCQPEGLRSYVWPDAFLLPFSLKTVSKSFSYRIGKQLTRASVLLLDLEVERTSERYSSPSSR